MGNVPSGETEPSRLQEELADMHRSLQALSVRCRPPPVLRPGQISVENMIIDTRNDVKVVLGPVVGKVEFQRARVLLEVNRRALVTAHVSTLDAATNSMVEAPQYRVSVNCEADRPAVFVLERLVPGKRYTVTFGGVREEDVETKRGTFQTQSLEHGSRLNVVAVSGDSVYDMESGEASLWKDVRERVQQDRTQIVLHLGGQVAMKPMFDKAVQLLLLHGEGLSSDVTSQADWSTMEAKAMEVLRSAYHSQWTLSPHLQFVLANASNLMLWSDEDIYPRFTTRDEFYINHEQPTLRMQVIRTVMRCARRLYLEYQRQLWDEDFKQLIDREAELLTIAEKALASTAQIFSLSTQILKTMENVELQKKRHEIEGARRVEKNLRALEAEKIKVEKQLVSYNQVLAPQRGDEFLFEVGNIGILMLDLRSNRLEPGGSQARENELLSSVQWRFIEETLELTSIQLLLVCSEAPLIDDVAQDLKSSVGTTPEETETSWNANAVAQVRLLSQLFDWKLQQPTRQFVVLAGANPVRCFANMRVKDTKLRVEAEQITIGAISALPHRSVLPKSKGFIHDRFEFEHIEDIKTTKCFLELKLECTPSNIIETKRIGKDMLSINLSKVLLGPIVGWVDETCAVILLEVDRNADVVCLVENPLTRESRRVFQRFVAQQANSFFITHLRSGHFYRVSFENVQYPDQFHASFTTVAKSPQQFNVIALCNENKALEVPGMLNEESKEPNLWHTIAENTTETPFVGLNLTVHLGGQFFPESNVHIHEALVYAGNTIASSNQLLDLKEREDSANTVILSKFREMYRAAWNAPGSRQSLAHGAHLILTNENDQLPLNNQDGEDQQNVSVRELLAKFHMRYQNLLLPPSKRLRGGEVRWRKPLFHCFGAFGLFVLPIPEREDSCIHESTWSTLQVLLATPTLTKLLLVSTEALIDESLESIREKSTMDAAYRRKFGFYRQGMAQLLELLFNWQRIDPAIEKTSQSIKHVVLLSGSRYQSFNSVIREVYNDKSDPTSTLFPNLPSADSQTLFQCVVGPLRAPSSENCRSAFFTQGTLLERYTYRHCFVHKASPIAEQVPIPLPTATDMCDSNLSPMQVKRNVGSEVGNQLLHLVLSTQERSFMDASDLDPTELPASLGTCSFVSHDRLESVLCSNKDSTDSPFSAELQVRCCQIDYWGLSTVLPTWLRELLDQATSEAEEEQVNERLAYLRERESEIQDAFQRSSSFVSGLVTLSNPRTCVAALTSSFKSAYRLGDSNFHETFPEAPSQLIVAFMLQQLRASEPPVLQSPTAGSVEFEQYVLIFQQSFVNTWLFNRRLEEFWR